MNWKNKPTGDGWYKVRKLSGKLTSGFIKNNSIKFSSDDNYYELEYMLGLKFFGPFEKVNHGLIHQNFN